MSWRALNRICRARSQIVQALLVVDSNLVSSLERTFGSVAAFHTSSTLRYEIYAITKDEKYSVQRDRKII